METDEVYAQMTLQPLSPVHNFALLGIMSSLDILHVTLFSF